MKPIIRSSQHNPGIIGFSVIGVSEIEIGPVVDIPQERILDSPPVENHLIPSHVGNLYGTRESFNPAPDDIEAPVYSPLFALCEQEMHSQTDSQQRSARLPPFGQEGEKTPILEVLNSLGEGAHAG
jgi:hypothetical protein